MLTEMRCIKLLRRQQEVHNFYMRARNTAKIVYYIYGYKKET